MPILLEFSLVYFLLSLFPCRVCRGCRLLDSSWCGEGLRCMFCDFQNTRRLMLLFAVEVYWCLWRVQCCYHLSVLLGCRSMRLRSSLPFWQRGVGFPDQLEISCAGRCQSMVCWMVTGLWERSKIFADVSELDVLRGCTQLEWYCLCPWMSSRLRSRPALQTVFLLCRYGSAIWTEIRC